LDLLGQGKSAKPGRQQGIEYSIHLWAALIDSYIQHHIVTTTTSNNNNHHHDPRGGLVLCGNSLGSLVALSAVTGDFRLEHPQEGRPSAHQEGPSSWAAHHCRGICMFNCGVGLNSRGIANEDQWTPSQRFLINALYNVLDVFLFRNTILLSYILNQVVTKDLLRSTLQSLYKFQPDRVDDELVDSFYQPAKDVGSVEALSQIYTNDPGATPMDLHRKYDDSLLRTLPLHFIWGNDDAVTPLEGGVGQYYRTMARERPNVSFDVIPSGHIPFDDNPDASHQSMLQWLQTLS
jgi:pimeloyl-ACP methyl ester carboxylesterase